MPKVRMVLNPDGVDDLLDDPRAARFVAGGAREFASTAATLAPDGGPGRGVRESYRSTKARREDEAVVATVYSTDPFAHLVEWGSVNNPAYGPLRRAAQRLGLRTRLASKGE